MGYKIYYKQDIDGVTETQSIDTFDNIFTLNPLNSAWSTSGCYAGATPSNGSQIGSYSIASWSGWRDDPAMSDMRDVSVSSFSGNSTQNLRFMVLYNNNVNTPIIRQSFKWTGIVPERAEQITEEIETNLNQSSYKFYSPYSRRDVNVSLHGADNSPLLNAPLTSLKINQLIFFPTFIFAEHEYYNYNNKMSGYQNMSVRGVRKLWSAIKPEDKTPAGVEFDEDLYENGWKEIPPEHSDGKRFIHCIGVVLEPYYGKSSYKLIDGSYVQTTNPEDNKVYGVRNKFGTLQTPQEESPTIVNNYYRNPHLYVMTENYDNNGEGVCYSMPAGLYFSNDSGSVSLVDSFFNSYTVSSNYQYITGVTWTPAFSTSILYSNNNMYKDFKSGDTVNSDLSIYSDVLYNNITISPIYDIDEPYTGIIYYVQNNGQAYSFSLGYKNLQPTVTKIYSIKSLWATIASLGCYVASDAETAQKAQTGFYANDNSRLYLGHMSSNGITDGVMLQGKDIQSSVQAGIDDIIQNTPYTPVIPKPDEESGGIDDNDKGTGTNLPNLGVKMAGSGGFTSYYLLSPQGVASLQSALSVVTNTFWEALGTATDYSQSNLIKYIMSLKWYPIDILAGNQGVFADVQTTSINFAFNQNTQLPIQGGNYKLGSTIRLYNMGSISIPYKLQNETFLDKDPYTTVNVWLPFCGLYPLKADFVVGNTLQFYYIVDLTTGMTTAIVTNDRNTLLSVTGKIGVDYAVSGNDVITQSERIAGSYINGALSAVNGGVSLGGAIAGKNALGAIQAGSGLLAGIAKSSIDIASAKRAVPVAVSAGSGFGATFAPNTPCVIVNPPAIKIPADYGHTTGYVYNQSAKISSMSGLIVCDNPDLSNIIATQAEKNEIYSLLTSGIYV